MTQKSVVKKKGRGGKLAFDVSGIKIVFPKIAVRLYDDLIFSDKPRIPISFPSTHQHPEHNF